MQKRETKRVEKVIKEIHQNVFDKYEKVSPFICGSNVRQAFFSRQKGRNRKSKICVVSCEKLEFIGSTT
jgi:hypothetical protein